MAQLIDLEVRLYGSLARFGRGRGGPGHAFLRLRLPTGSTMWELIRRLRMPANEKGLTFVNGQLTDMPGLGADTNLSLADGDRIGIFDTRSMWPFQYRHGASLAPELRAAMTAREGVRCTTLPGPRGALPFTVERRSRRGGSRSPAFR